MIIYIFYQPSAFKLFSLAKLVLTLALSVFENGLGIIGELIIYIIYGLLNSTATASPEDLLLLIEVISVSNLSISLFLDINQKQIPINNIDNPIGIPKYITNFV